MVFTFVSFDEILLCDYSAEATQALFVYIHFKLIANTDYLQNSGAIRGR